MYSATRTGSQVRGEGKGDQEQGLTSTLVRRWEAPQPPPSASTTSRIRRYTSNWSSPVPWKTSSSSNGSNTGRPGASSSTRHRDKVKSISVAVMPDARGESGTTATEAKVSDCNASVVGSIPDSGAVEERKRAACPP